MFARLSWSADAGLRGDKVVLPPSVLESALGGGGLGGRQQPLAFALTSARGARVFVGVREFSAAEGAVRLPAAVAEALGLSAAAVG